ncbi:MAG TPA: glycosyltransferase family A protein [Acidimicrobiales bacterium]|nr:glycosyltransferase family A protein [Acidimicrobiales bacterium]
MSSIREEQHVEPTAATAGPPSGPATLITVVLCTYNRCDRVVGAVQAILAQEGCAFELVVVDDGSTDDTQAVLAAIDDDRLRVLRRPNGGLSRARNSGLAAAAGDWVTFIDDDDLAEPGWLATFHEQTGDPTVGIVCCGATFVTAAGDELFPHHPKPLGQPYGNDEGSWLAGTFAVRTDLIRRAGGYLDGLGNRHQSELFLRLLATARDEGLRMTSADVLKVRIEGQPATERRDVNPQRLYDTTRWILARHVDAFAGQRGAIGRWESIAGINAAWLGEWAAARRHLGRAVRASPRSPVTWGRLALACVPAVGRRVWHRHGSWDAGIAGRPGVPAQGPGDEPDGGRELFLAWGYRENPAAEPGGAGGTAPDAAPADRRPAAAPARRLAERLARRRGWSPVVDAGADPAVGGDEGDGAGLGDSRGPAGGGGASPGLLVCLDEIQRVDDPVGLLHGLDRRAAGAPILVSTPDAAAVAPDRPLGPPADPGHRREWTVDQFELLLYSTGFAVERIWHLPAGVRRHRPVMAFLVRARAG